jgi:hypothetical protein
VGGALYFILNCGNKFLEPDAPLNQGTWTRYRDYRTTLFLVVKIPTTRTDPIFSELGLYLPIIR